MAVIDFSNTVTISFISFEARNSRNTRKTRSKRMIIMAEEFGTKDSGTYVIITRKRSKTFHPLRKKSRILFAAIMRMMISQVKMTKIISCTIEIAG